MMPVMMPIPSSIPNRSGAISAARAPRHSSRPNANNDRERSDQSKFFADDRKNKIRIRIRQIKQLLLALVQILRQTRRPTDRIKRLDDLISRVVRVFERIEKRHEPLHSPRRKNDRPDAETTIAAGDRCDMQNPCSGRKINGREYRAQNDRRAQILLKKYKPRQQNQSPDARNDGRSQSPTVFSFFVRKYARNIGNAIFASSDGWNENPAKRIQRLAPLIAGNAKTASKSNDRDGKQRVNDLGF